MTTNVEELILTFGYLGVFLGLYLEYLVPALPMQVVIPVAGLLISQDDLNFWGVLIAGTAGATLGSYTLFLLGDHWQQHGNIDGFIEKYGRWLTLNQDDVNKAQGFIERYGGGMVLFSHVIPLSIIRVAVSILAGSSQMARPRFVLFVALGSVIWNGGQLYAVVALGRNWNTLLIIGRPLEPLLWVAGGLILLGLAAWYVKRLKNYS